MRGHDNEVRLPVTCGDDLLGYITLTGSDNFWVLGELTPGRDFDAHRRLFEQLQELGRRADVAGEEEYEAASDSFLDALDEVNELGIRVGDPGELVREFKIDEQRRVEFRYPPDP